MPSLSVEIDLFRIIAMPEKKTLKIDFVSDVVCPWCAIGLKSLEKALHNLDGQVVADLHFQPFELNPDMVPEGEDVAEHLAHKYGSTPEQMAKNQEGIRQRGAELGFTFNMDKRSRIYNTFDAHRLLHWAEQQGKQYALKTALLKAYFTDGENVSSHDVLARAAEEAGLDATEARKLLNSNRYAEEVREQERFYQSQGIRAVPSVIINGRYLIQGGQPPEAFEQILRQVMAEPEASG
jgi:predicted DsbA family dithiol-disulfide isomerase